MAHKKHEHHGETRHDGTRTPEYYIWTSMIQRCTNPAVDGYERYGGRGIKVCSRWREYGAFLTDMGRRPSSTHTIERKNNDGDYEPGNCIWATWGEQARNKKTNHLVTAFGRTRCITDWAEDLGAVPSAIARRLASGWPAEDAVSIPPRFEKTWTIEARGKVRNLGEWARESGTARSTIQHRLEEGWPAEEAIFGKPGIRGCGRKQSVFLTVQGTTRSLDDWARECGVQRTTIEERLKRGWSEEKAVLTPTDSKKSAAGKKSRRKK